MAARRGDERREERDFSRVEKIPRRQRRWDDERPSATRSERRKTRLDRAPGHAELLHPTLSIVIPVSGDPGAFESGLVSVLANRPRAAEIVAVLNTPYHDPYQLAGEVRFVEAPAGAGWAECANRGIEAARGPIVHLLAPGAEVAEGWTDAALRHFRASQVAAVAPVLRAPGGEGTVLTAGVEYTPGGRRLEVRERGLAHASDDNEQPLAPVRWAGFYRREVLELLDTPFDPAVGEELVDVDLGLRLAHAGLQTVIEPECEIFLVPPRAPRLSGYEEGRLRERLFLRNVPVAGWGESLAWHPWTVLRELLDDVANPRAWARLWGRLRGSVEVFDLGRHHAYLANLRDEGQASIELLPLETHRRLEQSARDAQPGAERASDANAWRRAE